MDMKYLQKHGNWIIILAGIVLLISSLAAIPDGISTSLAQQRIPPQDDTQILTKILNMIPEISFWAAAAAGGVYILFRR